MNKINCPHCGQTAIEDAEDLAEGKHELVCANCQKRFDFDILSTEQEAGALTNLQRRIIYAAYRALSMFSAELGKLLEEDKQERMNNG